MSRLKSQKKDHIVEFIRVAILRPEQIDALLPQITEALMDDYKSDIQVETVKEFAKNQILSNEYLEQFIPIVEQTFSEKEIRRLIQFYKDDAVEKYFKHGGAIGSAIYSSFGEVIASVLSNI